MILQWFLSRAVRQATAMRKHVRKLLNHQRDILSEKAISELEAAMRNVDQAVAERADKAALEKQMEELEKTANKWLKPYPNAQWRENVEVLLVALTIAMGIRTFFLQPFKIPTGSMQPTLYGVTSVPDYGKARSQDEADEQSRLRDALTIPGGLQRAKEWFQGISYVHIVAENDGTLQAVGRPLRFLIFSIRQTLVVGGKTYTIWFPPDYGSPPAGTLEGRSGIRIGQFFRRGEDVVKLKVQSGDHLFVDRMTYNFRVPRRGEISVFETKGIHGLRQDQFYIKRLVALGGERVQMGNDRHLIIDGRRLDSSTPRFENIYAFDPGKPPRDSEYSGHVNQLIAEKFGYHGALAPLFPNESAVFTLADRHLMVMGDNTVNSLDSRTWGDFSSTNVIGKSFFVYWPITERFGWGHR